LIWPALAFSFTAVAGTAASAPRFEIALPPSSHPQPISGRLFLMISRHNEPEVRLQSTWFTSPEIVGVDVRRWAPGKITIVDATALGTPLSSLGELPPGDYYVQAVLNIYTEFHRSDGRVVWAHMDRWEGQQFNTSPGNLFSRVEKLHIDTSRQDNTFKLTLTEVIPALPPPADAQWVKYVKIQSKLLSRFWGQPIYIGAVVLLPCGYESSPGVRYPVVYAPAGHFTLAAPLRFGVEPELTAAWQSGQTSPLIAVSLLDPTPLSDWSGGVNSVNNGPYGDAIMTELIPFIEGQFRIIRVPSSRVLTGNASGGREALALQLYHPDFFGGAWIFQPWPFDFRHYSALDIYQSANAFQLRREELPVWARGVTDWLPLERYIGRIGDGTPFVTFRQLSRHDAVMAGMAGGDPIGADDAILGPIGDNGYPKPLWDRTSGAIDREVANYWLTQDLAHYTIQNWTTIGPKLAGKLHFYAGETDHFYRNHGVHALEDDLKANGEPLYGATFEYGPLKADWQPMSNVQLIQVMFDHIHKNTP
jgi:hypothetical protein